MDCLARVTALIISIALILNVVSQPQCYIGLPLGTTLVLEVSVEIWERNDSRSLGVVEMGYCQALQNTNQDSEVTVRLDMIKLVLLLDF